METLLYDDACQNSEPLCIEYDYMSILINSLLFALLTLATFFPCLGLGDT